MTEHYFVWDEKSTHATVNVLISMVEQSPVAKITLNDIAPIDENRKIALTVLREVTAPHKRKDLPELDDESQSKLSALRVETFFTALCGYLSSERTTDETVTPYSFSMSDGYGSNIDQRMRKQANDEVATVLNNLGPKKYFDIARMGESARLIPFARIEVDEASAPPMKEALLSTCYVMARIEPRLREHINAGRHDPDARGTSSEPRND